MNNAALNKIGYGLYILTAKNDKKDNGCIINTLIQVTSNPTKILIAVNKQNYTHDIIFETGVFNVSVLTESVPFEVFKHFGFQSGINTDKFSNPAALVRSANGLVYIPTYTNAYISGKVSSVIDSGTHSIFISDVTDMELLSDEPSITYAYYHNNTKPKPQKSEKTGYRCKICGYVYEGEQLPDDFICPICKHGAEDFEKIQ